jgi:23S rRNA-/tRNA-specific pseudouridylate synthase
MAHPRAGQAGNHQLSRLQTHARIHVAEVTTGTGRKHQIRVHLAGLGHPIIGDKEYGSKKSAEPAWPARESSRLHAR